MKEIRWSSLKSDQLKRTRGISFEEILGGRLLDILRHPTRPHQSILVYEYRGYIWAVPFVEAEGHIFLKTVYPSHKLTEKYREKEV